MSFAEIVVAVVVGLFAIAFGAWAHRLDRALDLLERLQESMHLRAILIERRLTRLETRNNIDHQEPPDRSITPE